jgi:hypothetical protein
MIEMQSQRETFCVGKGCLKSALGTMKYSLLLFILPSWFFVSFVVKNENL